MSEPRARPRTRGPTDPSLATTGAVAAGATVAFYVGVVRPLAGTAFGDLFGDRGWVPYVITFLSAWAGVVLAEKWRRVSRQREALDLDLLPERLGARITPDGARAFVEHLDGLPPRVSDGLLATRVRRALEHFQARRDAREVVAQLESQAQTDADSVESSYTMVRAFIWAVPILGFIGTVIGIGAAVGGFSESVGAAVDLEVMKESIGSVTSGLAVAFDTTLLALVMSILIMFPASSLQKLEENLLTEVEDYCDEALVRRLDDAKADDRPEERVIRDAIAAGIAAEMEPHHAELRLWLDRLGQIGETLTTHVVSGWEKIDEQLRLRQERQLERLSDWAGTRQREAHDEQAELQRGVLRDFRVALEGMAAEARRLQEESAHRIDEQAAGLERLHRRLLEEHSAAAEAQGAQRSELMAAGEQLAHTLARVRSEAADARDEGARQLERLGERAGELARAFEGRPRRLQDAAEEQARSLRDAGERLAATLSRVDAQIARIREASDAQLSTASEQLEAMDAERSAARRREAELREGQHAALVRASEELSAVLSDLRREADAARRRFAADLEGGALRIERAVAAAAPRGARGGVRDLLRRGLRAGDRRDDGGPRT